MAILPKKKGEEDKVAQGLFRLMEEDPAIRFENNTETHQMVVSGLGEQHLDVLVSRLKTKFGVELHWKTPCGLSRDNSQKGAGAGTSQEANRRPWPVW